MSPTSNKNAPLPPAGSSVAGATGFGACVLTRLLAEPLSGRCATTVLATVCALDVLETTGVCLCGEVGGGAGSLFPRPPLCLGASHKLAGRNGSPQNCSPTAAVHLASASCQPAGHTHAAPDPIPFPHPRPNAHQLTDVIFIT